MNAVNDWRPIIIGRMFGAMLFQLIVGQHFHEGMLTAHLIYDPDTPTDRMDVF